MSLPATDNFNRADENPLSNGGKWTLASSDCKPLKVLSNQVAASDPPGWDNAMMWTGDEFSADQYSQIKIAAFDGSSGPLVRVSNSGSLNWYFLGVGPNSQQFERILNGSWQEIGNSFSASVQVGDTVKVTAVGITLSFYLNGVLQGSIEDNTIATGYPGIDIYDGADCRFDDWEGGNVGAAGGLSIPVAMHYNRMRTQ